MRSRSNQVRIIGGQWRGRKLTFPAVEGLRPTPDRIRETLFNWLAPLIAGASCLDLFAGSGALGFEAASRGAARVVMVDHDPDTVRALKRNRKLLGAEMIEIVEQKAVSYLADPSAHFDLVFLDPPFQETRLLESSIRVLTESHCLNAGARLYLETPAKTPASPAPDGCSLLKQKQAGQVVYRLYAYQSG